MSATESVAARPSGSRLRRRHTRCWIAGSLVAGFLFTPFAAALAQGTAQSAPPPTLADALLSASPPQGVVIAVDAENTRLPNGSASPERRAPVEAVSRAFARLYRTFGTVTAVAPPTMEVLNTHPSGENPYLGMDPKSVFKLLLAGLNDAGWQALTSERGLGMENLQTPDAQGMFMALFPGGSLDVALKDSGASPAIRSKTLTASQLSRSRIRLAKQVQMMLPAGENGRAAGDDGPSKPGAPGQYTVEYHGSSSDPWGTIGGVPARSEAANIPKPSQLNLKDARFRALIPRQGMNTVGDLVERIGRQTRTELYADARLERLSLTMIGTSRSAPAADLLRALCLCLTGTFRNVGPAFVLTDDVVGVATRQEILRRFAEKVYAERGAAVQPADQRLNKLTQHFAALPYSSDSLSIPPEEMQFQKKEPGVISNALITLHVPFVALPSEQQDLAKRMYAKMTADEARQAATPYYQEHPDRLANLTHVSLQGDITIAVLPTLQLDAPGLDGPVDLGQYTGTTNLATQGTGISGLGTVTINRTPYTPPPPPSGPAVAAMLARFGRRACLAAPQSLAEIDSILDEMPQAGLNELWLKVPPPENSSGKDKPSAGAMVDEALKHARCRGIAVLPVMDLLAWGTKAPAADVDYTVNGQNSLQWPWPYMTIGNGTYMFPWPDAPPPRLLVSLFAPGVSRAIAALQQEVLRKGIAGVVWSQIAPDGYSRRDDGEEEQMGGNGYFLQGPRIITLDGAQGDFGYHLQARLLFLRQTHVDPVDIPIQDWGALDTHVPHFADGDTDTALRAAWRAFRRAGDLALLQSLYTSTGFHEEGSGAIPATGQTPPVMLDLPGAFQMYVEWDDRRTLPFVPGARTMAALSAAVRSQTRHALLPISHRALSSTRRLASDLSEFNPAGNTLWDGAVLNLPPTSAEGTAPARSSLENLHQLIEMLRSNG